MTESQAAVADTREFEFVLQFDAGADKLMDVFRQHESLSVWSSAIFVGDDHMWRLDHAKGTPEALNAFDEVFLDEKKNDANLPHAGPRGVVTDSVHVAS